MRMPEPSQLSATDPNEGTEAQPFLARELAIAAPDRAELSVPVSHTLSDQSWWPDVVTRLRWLAALLPNWNGYGDHIITDNALRQTVRVLERVAVGGPKPDIVPIFDGGVQIEWGVSPEVEIDVAPTGASVEVYLCDEDEPLLIVDLSDTGRHRSDWTRIRAAIGAPGGEDAVR